ncbi:MAG: hypothetical protein JJT94_02435 [Bernardetiaceae bacterium]|nr:hypothetical protein [Bernardetiaceae bacterium]
MKVKVRALFLIFVTGMLLSLASCVHAPKQAWTPNNSKGKMARKKNPKPKDDKPVMSRKVW